MNSGHQQDIVILGGGAAGWIAAALLAKKTDRHQTRITLVESEEIGIIGVGEATVPVLAQCNALLGIEEFDFIRSTQGKMTHFDLDGGSGNITAIHLANGVTVAGDLFLDCTGFASALLGKALNTPYVDWSRWLLCNSAMAVPSKRTGAPTPFTRSTAHA